MDKLNIKSDLKNQIPLTAKGRIKELLDLPLADKKPFIPDVGMRFRFGPFLYEVAITNPGKLRFTAKLVDVIIEGVNDKTGTIINPKTGKEF